MRSQHGGLGLPMGNRRWKIRLGLGSGRIARTLRIGCRRNIIGQRMDKSHSARCNRYLISWGKRLRSVDLGSVQKSAVTGPQVPKYPVTVLEKYFSVTAAGTLIGDWNFVRRSPADYQGLASFQTKNVGPAVSLANNQVGRLVVWLHRAKAEIN